MTRGAGDRDGGGRPPESAAFEPARLGTSRGARPPVLAVAFVVVLGAVVIAGLGGRIAPGSFPVGDNDLAVATLSPTAPPSPGASSFSRPVVPAPPGRGIPAFPADTGPIYTSAPGPMAGRRRRRP